MNLSFSGTKEDVDHFYHFPIDFQVLQFVDQAIKPHTVECFFNVNV